MALCGRPDEGVYFCKVCKPRIEKINKVNKVELVNSNENMKVFFDTKDKSLYNKIMLVVKYTAHELTIKKRKLRAEYEYSTKEVTDTSMIIAVFCCTNPIDNGMESFVNWCDSLMIASANEGLFFNRKKESDKPKSKPLDSATINKVKTEVQKLSREFNSKQRSRSLNILKKALNSDDPPVDYDKDDLSSFNYNTNSMSGSAGDDFIVFSFDNITQGMFFDGIDDILYEFTKELSSKIPEISVDLGDDSPFFEVKLK